MAIRTGCLYSTGLAGPACGSLLMDAWQAFVLGLVEGLTEYLPVSSTGHLLVVQRLLGIETNEASNAYAIAIQAGAIAAVLGLYRERVRRMVLGVLGRDAEGASLARAIVVAFIPAAIIGLTFEAAIEEYLFGPWPIVMAWASGGFLLLALGPRLRAGREGLPLEAMTLRIALIVGLVQCVAMWPGVSRSLATILGGMFAGLSMVAAVEFSFLLGLVTLGAATVYKSLGSGAVMMEAYGPVPIAVGFVTAWVSAVVAVRGMVAWLNRHGFAVFAWWRIGAAALVTVLMLTGAME